MRQKTKKSPSKKKKNRLFKNKGSINGGAMYMMGILSLVVLGAYIMAGGTTPSQNPQTTTGNPVVVDPAKIKKSNSSLQLYTFSGATITPLPTQQPTPTPTPISTPSPTPTPIVCENIPTDIMLLIDRSSSMDTGNRIQEAKVAAKGFVDVIAAQPAIANKIGLVSFDATATLNKGLTSDFTSIKNKIDSISLGSGTCHECGVVKANQEISTNGRAGIKKVIILLTDGRANHRIGKDGLIDEAEAETYALNAVKNAFNTNKIVFFPIGFGNEQGDDSYNRDFMETIATLTGGKHYYPKEGELGGVYLEISGLIGKGLLGGFIFKDSNDNGSYNSGEPKLGGWNIQLISSSGTQTLTSDSAGYYSTSGLCDGNYQLKEIVKSGWLQTLPTDPNGYYVTITNGSSFTNKNFGNWKP